MKLQYINDNSGRPQFVVLPIAEYERLVAGDSEEWEDIPYESDEYDNVTIPGAVVDIMFDKDISLAAAWRIYRGISQTEAAERAGISQSALSQIEKKGTRLQEKTRIMLAGLYQCDPEQLTM